MKICIIGAGVTGLILLLMLTQAGVKPQDITIIDPHFDGGDICRKWGGIRSNTQWGKTITNLRKVLPGINIPDSFDLEATTPLEAIGQLLIRLTTPLPVKRINGFVTRLESKSNWRVEYYSQGPRTLEAPVVILAQGSDAKVGSLPIPSIPLECALDARIEDYLKPSDHVVLYGTMHSGTLVMKNLNRLGIRTTAVYKGQPFVWDRDGAYDGIKQEAAEVADAVVAGAYKNLTLVPLEEAKDIKATWAVYAMGFTPRSIEVVVKGRSVVNYDGRTGQIAPGAWGFGIAYPNLAPDGVHWDVSVAAFALHIEGQISSILKACAHS
jgi:pyruvate/2-oxoglutarate dehydrogenase complex dihydrolipoamide dehydrogenase (E3) component